ncbi:MAG: substrate-binding domain-containing protein [Burkholderiaceae bacterium]
MTEKTERNASPGSPTPPGAEPGGEPGGRLGRPGRPDITMVASRAGVAPATVSRVFNQPEKVRAATRERVLKAAHDLGYIRNRAVGTMHGRVSGCIGLVVPELTNSIFSEIIQSFSDVVSEAGYTVLMATHGYDARRELSVITKLLEHRVDAVALIGLERLNATYALLKRQQVPAIALWQYDPHSIISCVGVDNQEAGYLAASHLIDLGHRKIGIAFPPTGENERARARLAGVNQALAQAGLNMSEDWRIEAVYDVSRAKSAIVKLLDGPDLPTALVCGNDIIAQGALFAAQRLRLSVPGELSIVGIGDFPESADLEPGLTTVHIPAVRIGRQAGHHLTISIAERSGHQILRSKLDVELIVRSTTAAPGA